MSSLDRTAVTPHSIVDTWYVGGIGGGIGGGISGGLGGGSSPFEHRAIVFPYEAREFGGAARDSRDRRTPQRPSYHEGQVKVAHSPSPRSQTHRCCCREATCAGFHGSPTNPLKFRALVVNNNISDFATAGMEERDSGALATKEEEEEEEEDWKEEDRTSRGIREDIMESIRAVITSAETLDEKQRKLNSMISQLQSLKENLTKEQERLTVRTSYLLTVVILSYLWSAHEAYN